MKCKGTIKIDHRALRVHAVLEVLFYPWICAVTARPHPQQQSSQTFLLLWRVMFVCAATELERAAGHHRAIHWLPMSIALLALNCQRSSGALQGPGV